jgi:hypothetical protein
VKYIITIILTALVVGLGVTAYFKGWLPSVTFNKPQAASIQNTEVSNTVVVATPTASPAPSVDDTQTILVAVKAALIAKHGSSFSDLNYSINKVEGNYASGGVNGTGGGGMWFAAKVNGSWVIVSDGNGTIDCSSLTPYPNFPNDMIPECWDSSINKSITR